MKHLRKTVTAGLGLAASLAVVAAPVAAHADGAPARGKVVAKTSLQQHVGPTTAAPSSGGSYKKGTVLSIDCKLPGTVVGGNTLWYKLAGRNAWVSAKYVANVGAAPLFCLGRTPDDPDATTTAYLALRQGPSTSDTVRGHVAKGGTVALECRVSSRSVAGNTTWYYTNDGWVSGHYVHNTVPVHVCTAPPH